MTINTKLRKFFEPKRRSLIFTVWLSGVIIYDGLRAVVVNYFFSSHGINGWRYFMVEIIFSLIFAWASFQLVISLIDNRLKVAWIFGFLTFLTFFAPDVYIVITSNKTPTSLYVGLLCYLILTAIITVRSLRHDIHKKRSKNLLN